MGTRTTINIYGITYASIYNHWHNDDLYDWLVEFNREFEEKRPKDPQYKFAQLLRHSSLFSSIDDEPYTGWGVTPYNEGGSDYTITLFDNGTCSPNPY